MKGTVFICQNCGHQTARWLGRCPNLEVLFARRRGGQERRLGRAADFDETRKYPVAFLIHGGPQGSFGNDFHYRWNPQTYAGAGFAAVMIDFHGSTGYGQAFTDAISGHWGDRPYEDLDHIDVPVVDHHRLLQEGLSLIAAPKATKNRTGKPFDLNLGALRSVPLGVYPRTMPPPHGVILFSAQPSSTPR